MRGQHAQEDRGTSTTYWATVEIEGGLWSPVLIAQLSQLIRQISDSLIRKSLTTLLAPPEAVIV